LIEGTRSMQKHVDDRGTGNPPETPSAPKRGFKWVIVPVLVFAALTALFAFALTTGDPSKLPSALIGKPVPATEFPALADLTDGTHPVPGFTSKELAGGNVSIVNFWASWCVPCAEEQALLIALKDKTGVPIYGVNYKDQVGSARRFLGRYGNPFKAVGTDDNGRGAIEWGVYGMPETFVVNGKGEIVFKHVGPISPESLISKLIPAIESARKPVAGS
jgi:cytochrome c biogenesis protein CcmG/thiol:disulfide interchange protein DsbE